MRTKQLPSLIWCSAASRRCNMTSNSIGLADEHRRHRRIVPRQCSMARRWWHEPESPRPGGFVVGPARCKVEALVSHHVVEQIEPGQRFGAARVAPQRLEVRVVAGEAVTDRQFGRPVVLGVQDRRLLPERAGDLQRDHICPKIVVGARQIDARGLRQQCGDAVRSDGLLVGQGAELQLHLLGDVAAGLRERRRIREQQVRRARQCIDFVAQPIVRMLRRAEHGRDGCFECWAKALRHALLALGFERLHALSALTGRGCFVDFCRCEAERAR